MKMSETFSKKMEANELSVSSDTVFPENKVPFVL